MFAAVQPTKLVRQNGVAPCVCVVWCGGRTGSTRQAAVGVLERGTPPLRSTKHTTGVYVIDVHNVYFVMPIHVPGVVGSYGVGESREGRKNAHSPVAHAHRGARLLLLVWGAWCWCWFCVPGAEFQLMSNAHAVRQ